MKFKIFLRLLFYAPRLAPAHHAAFCVLRIKLMPKKRAPRQPHASGSKKRGTAAYFLFAPSLTVNLFRELFFSLFCSRPLPIYTELFSLLLFCAGSITLCIMIWRTIKLCCVRSRFPVCFRETSNLLCAVASEREKTPKGAIQIWQCARFNFVLRPEF